MKPAVIKWLLGVLASIGVCLLIAPGGAPAAPKCTIVGTPGPDVLRGTKDADVICGRGGPDVIEGEGGNDVLVGGPGKDRIGGDVGNDLLLGGPGRDRLDGGPGADSLHGGAGADRCISGVAHGCFLENAPRRPHRAAGGEETREAGGLCPALCPPPIEEAPDVTPPTFSFLTMDRAADVASGGAVGFNVDAWDERGVASVTVNLLAPDGSPWQSVSLSEADPFDWRGSLAVAAQTPLGVYEVGSVVVVDRSGNTTTVTPELLAAEGDDDQLSVYRGPDDTAPSLESFAVSPASTATSAGPVDVVSLGRVTDTQSGVKAMNVTVRFPNHATPPYTFSVNTGSRLRSGTQDDGIQASTFELPQWAYPGTYAITSVELQDFAGNVAYLEAPELEERGFPTGFEATAPGDTTPPEILGFSITPSVIPASGGTIESFIHVRDDLSGFGTFAEGGFSDLYVGFEWPPHSGPTETSGRGAELVSGDARDGTWMIETTFGPGVPPGEYSVSYLGAYDRALNAGSLDLAGLEARGWNLGFTKLP